MVPFSGQAFNDPKFDVTPAIAPMRQFAEAMGHAATYQALTDWLVPTQTNWNC